MRVPATVLLTVFGLACSTMTEPKLDCPPLPVFTSLGMLTLTRWQWVIRVPDVERDQPGSIRLFPEDVHPLALHGDSVGTYQ
jgi:hypothetical protein